MRIVPYGELDCSSSDMKIGDTLLYVLYDIH
jgi:hypothetical protein